jgi:hypothetical protein
VKNSNSNYFDLVLKIIDYENEYNSKIPHALHDALLGVLAECSNMRISEFKKHEGLHKIFSYQTKMVDKKALINWVHEFSPMRVKLDERGELRKIGTKKSKSLYLWDIEGASKVDWHIFYLDYIKRKEAGELLEALSDHHLIADKMVADYLKRNPVKDEMGKFGVPQDKYRWGFYGNKTMEYDSWSREHKGRKR